MRLDASPTARALLALELVQNSPGITAERLAEKLEVSERAARRYVGILREAGIPIESIRGPYGGYRLGRGARLPPLMFTPAEALGLVMAALDGHHQVSDPSDPVGSAIGKIVRALPESVGAQVEAVRRTTAPAPDRAAARPDPRITTDLVHACTHQLRIRIDYRSEAGSSGAARSSPGQWSCVTAVGTCCAGRCRLTPGGPTGLIGSSRSRCCPRPSARRPISTRSRRSKSIWRSAGSTRWMS